MIQKTGISRHLGLVAFHSNSENGCTQKLKAQDRGRNSFSPPLYNPIYTDVQFTLFVFFVKSFSCQVKIITVLF